jgi:glycosyltransferase involved in cell wall biosynthesis
MRRPLIAALMASETLYFINHCVYPRSTCRWLVWALERYDALLCVGDMQADLARSLLRSPATPIFSIPGAVSADRLPTLVANRPALDTKNLVCIANGPGGWRTWYKGLDLLVDTFERVAARHLDAQLMVAGSWDAAAVQGLLARLRTASGRVRFVGPQADLTHILSRASLYIHLGRGDAFPLAVLEAMCAGVPAIVSEATGTRQVVRDVDETMVVPLDADAAAERVVGYFASSQDARAQRSEAARSVALTYTEERAIHAFREAVDALSPCAKGLA